MKNDVLVMNDPAEVAEKLSERIVLSAKENILRSGIFNLVLTGGNSPKAIYALLSSKHKKEVDWEKVFFFFGDERHVPPFHKDYNGLMAREALLTPLNIREENIFYVNTNLKPEVAAADYFDRIKKHFSGQAIMFDLTLLGMGADAHTASIFPGTTLIDIPTASTKAVFVEKLQSWRISFTAKLINQSREIIFLVTGADKSAALREVLIADKHYSKYPARLIKGNVSWYVDKAAAGS